MALAKICGLSTADTVAAALDGGAAFVGVMFFAASPRAVTAEAAARLARAARDKAKIVAVTVDPDDALIATLKGQLQSDLIQLHGAETPARVREIAEASGAGVIKVIGVSEAADLDAAAAYEEVCDYLMFDAKPPGELGRPGGGGTPFDWSMLAGRRFARPWFLAGGLDPSNVAAAIAASGAVLVDVSSGVETAPGLKDPALIRAFLAAAN